MVGHDRSRMVRNRSSLVSDRRSVVYDWSRLVCNRSSVVNDRRSVVCDWSRMVRNRSSVVCAIGEAWCTIGEAWCATGAWCHWCLKSMKSGFARAKVPCLKNLDVLSPRIDAQKWTADTLKDTQESMTRGLQRLTDLFGHQVYLSFIWKAYSHQPLKLQLTMGWNNWPIYLPTLQWIYCLIHHQSCGKVDFPSWRQLRAFSFYDFRRCRFFFSHFLRS